MSTAKDAKKKKYIAKCYKFTALQTIMGMVKWKLRKKLESAALMDWFPSYKKNNSCKNIFIVSQR